FYGNEPLATKQALLKDALTRSPVGVSVYAWLMGPDGKYFKPQGVQDNHWVELVDYKEGEYWEIFDSYDQYLKQLEWSFEFGYAKEYSIEQHEATIPKYIQLLNYLAQLLHLDSLLIQERAAPIVVQEPHTSIIVPRDNAIIWARAIQTAEGWYPGSRSYVNN